MPEYRIAEGSQIERFFESTTKIKLLAGGYGNGKTAGVCVRALQLCMDYPGCLGVIARSTYPKLKDTIMKEFMKWCPRGYIKQEPNKSNGYELILNNGSTILFRYVSQKGKESDSGDTTSNLLSATLDWIIIDQCEDPEIGYKDFTDLMGRLRGSAKYRGTDPRMPRTGPRWLILTTNPTRNWVYRKLARPYHIWKQTGEKTKDLICDEKTGEVMIEVLEWSTYDNSHNLEPDFIQGLEATYKGQMRDRFLMGLWSAYEGLIYPQFDMNVHVVHHDMLVNYMYKLIQDDHQPTIVEAYDHGIAAPMCFMWGFADPYGNVFWLDGFHERNLDIEPASRRIKAIRNEYLGASQAILADPDIFRRKVKATGPTVADLYQQEDITMIRASNDIEAGIAKVSSYLNSQQTHMHPLYGTANAPYMYFSSKLSFVTDEITEYYWDKDESGEFIDKPRDRNDHAMDTIKYGLSHRPALAKLVTKVDKTPSYLRKKWFEQDRDEGNNRSHRYG